MAVQKGVSMDTLAVELRVSKKVGNLAAYQVVPMAIFVVDMTVEKQDLHQDASMVAQTAEWLVEQLDVLVAVEMDVSADAMKAVLQDLRPAACLVSVMAVGLVDQKEFLQVVYAAAKLESCLVD